MDGMRSVVGVAGVGVQVVLAAQAQIRALGQVLAR